MPSPTATALSTAQAEATLDIGAAAVQPAPSTDLPESEKLRVPHITTPAEGIEVPDIDLIFVGEANSEANVVVYANGQPLGMVTADAKGQWTLTPPQLLPEAEYTIFARTTDGERVSYPSEPIQVMVVGERLPVTGGERTPPPGRGLASLVIAALAYAALSECGRRIRETDGTRY
jgi:hypothetical protein